MCTGTPAGTGDCLSGSTKYLMYVILADCSYVEVIFYTNSLAEAEACRQEYVNVALATEEICALDQQPDLTNVCSTHYINGNSGSQFWNCSAAQIQNCEAYFCSDCSWATADCP